MGDYVYAFSSGGATVHRTTDLQTMFELELPGNDPVDYNYVSEETGQVDDDSTESSEETDTHPCNDPDAEGCED